MSSRGRIIALFFILPIVFQNCSESANFSSASKSNEVGGLGDPNNPNDGDPNDPGNPGDPGTPDDPKEPKPPIVIVRVPPDIDTEVDFKQCDTYQEIAADVQTIALPKFGTSKICYYKKLINKVANHISGANGEKRVDDVMASNHNGDHNSYIAPYLVGENRLKFSNLPGWRIAISGSFNDPKAQMAIDNFFLLQLKYSSNPQIEIVSAFGTADAEPGSGKMPILLSSSQITEFKAFAPSGTAKVDALNLTPDATEVNNYLGEYDLRFRALDCGGSVNSTDVYLVFY